MSSPYNQSPFDPELIQVQRYTHARAMAKDCARRARVDEKPGSIVVSMAGGMRRWATFTEEDGFVSVRLMETEIMKFFPLWVEFTTRGAGGKNFNSVTTRSVINNLLPKGQVSASDRDPETGVSRVLYYLIPGTEEPIEVPSQALRVRYTGRIVSDEDYVKLQDREKEKKSNKKSKAKAKSTEPEAAGVAA